jgi:MFS family permease
LHSLVQQQLEMVLSSIYNIILGILIDSTVIGLIIGALLSSFASWPWILYFASILSFVLAAVAFVLLPATIPTSTRHQASNLRRLDSVGVFTLTGL